MATVINPMAATLAIRRSILENQFYTDEMTIEREGEYTDPDTEITTQGRVTIAEKVPCRLSINGYPSISSFSTHKESNASIKIFTAPETDLMEGDFVTVSRNFVRRQTKSCFASPKACFLVTVMWIISIIWRRKN